MARNIVIFSDGTGQVGGLVPDACHSNVYKLYRATRCGPDSDIDPAAQLTFYDPGLGSAADGDSIRIGGLRMIYNLLARATGLGITRNIIDCYAAIVSLWEPGDRIFLFGFSRGAYTVRCLGGVLGLCGVPTRMKDGSPLKRDPASAQAIAAEAVQRVYQHGAGKDIESRRGAELEEQRLELARNFRQAYGSNDDTGRANEVPYFIGVWDTVAALGVRPLHLGAVLLAACLLVLGAGRLFQALFGMDVSQASLMAVVLIVVGLLAWYLATHFKWAGGLSVPVWKTFHFTGLKMKFYDLQLNARVRHAKHALSIDENRHDFRHVPWVDSAGEERKVEKWFEQVWFAGVHSDVGGSYTENESRLSDIALQWMVEKAQAAEFPLLIDGRWLKPFPSAAGMQHDQRKGRRFALREGLRRIPDDAPLHPTVFERFKLPQVLHYDLMLPYRPAALANHEGFPRPGPKKPAPVGKKAPSASSGKKAPASSSGAKSARRKTGRAAPAK